jgi:hypothetical protein
LLGTHSSQRHKLRYKISLNISLHNLAIFYLFVSSDNNFDKRLLHFLNFQTICLFVVLGKSYLSLPFLLVKLRKRTLTSVYVLNHICSDFSISCNDSLPNQIVNSILRSTNYLLKQVMRSENSGTNIDLKTEAALQLTKSKLISSQNIQTYTLDLNFFFVEIFSTGHLIHFIVSQNTLDLVVK